MDAADIYLVNYFEPNMSNSVYWSLVMDYFELAMRIYISHNNLLYEDFFNSIRALL